MAISSVPASAFENAMAFQRALDLALVTRIEEMPWGTALYRDDLRRVTDGNVLVVHRDADSVDADTLVADAELLQGALPHRAIRVDDPAAAARLAPEFAGRGWVVSRTALMTLRRLPDRPIDTSGVTEVDLGTVRAARAAAIRRVHRDLAVAEEALDFGALEYKNAPVRAYASIVGNEVAAYCLLRIREDGAKLVEVEALARSQGQGVGRAVIWATALTARRERVHPIFAECEHSGWAKSVYHRLGFDEAGLVHRFVRPW